jgi:hypothetical protein
MFFDVDEHNVIGKVADGLEFLRSAGFLACREKKYSDMAVRFISPHGERYTFITALCYAKTGESYKEGDLLGELAAAKKVSFSGRECSFINAADAETETLRSELWGFWIPYLAYISYLRILLFRFPTD